MAPEVRRTEDPEQALHEAAEFLASDPVRHNVVLTLLHLRAMHPEPGRYWIVDVEGASAGVVVQSPLHFMATLTPMPVQAVTTVVDAIVEDGVELPGVNGEATTAARFAGHWTERTRSAAHPDEGQRIYEVEHVIAARPTGGRLRRASMEDNDLLVAWFEAFDAEVAGPMPENHAGGVGRRLRAGQL